MLTKQLTFTCFMTIPVPAAAAEKKSECHTGDESNSQDQQNFVRDFHVVLIEITVLNPKF
ncbi:MAG: hypothetical protein PVJ01_03270 [Pseudomonadota bacterium]